MKNVIVIDCMLVMVLEDDDDDMDIGELVVVAIDMSAMVLVEDIAVAIGIDIDIMDSEELMIEKFLWMADVEMAGLSLMAWGASRLWCEQVGC